MELFDGQGHGSVRVRMRNIARAISHLLTFDRTLQVRLLCYPFVKMLPTTKWCLSLVEERAYMFNVPQERMSFVDKECGAVTLLRLHTTVVRSG